MWTFIYKTFVDWTLWTFNVQVLPYWAICILEFFKITKTMFSFFLLSVLELICQWHILFKHLKTFTESRWISYSFKPKQVRWGSFSLNTRKHTRHIFKYAVAKKQIFARRTFLELRTVGKSCRLSVGVGVSNPV